MGFKCIDCDCPEDIKNNPQIDCKKRAKEYRNSDKGQDARLRNTYGISHEEFEIMYEECRGECYICGTSMDNEVGKRYMAINGLCVDHCHDSGNVRGLLCKGCNTMVGAYDKAHKLKLHNEVMEYINGL